MTSENVETYRAGHEAFNRRDFAAMTRRYADSITWTDHPQGRTFRTPREFTADFLAGWVDASPDIQIIDARYLDADRTVVCTFTVVGRQDGPLGPFPATGKQFTSAAVRDVALRPERPCRRRRPLLRPGLAADAVGPDAPAVGRVGGCGSVTVIAANPFRTDPGAKLLHRRRCATCPQPGTSWSAWRTQRLRRRRRWTCAPSGDRRPGTRTCGDHARPLEKADLAHLPVGRIPCARCRGWLPRGRPLHVSPDTRPVRRSASCSPRPPAEPTSPSPVKSPSPSHQGGTAK